MSESTMPWFVRAVVGFAAWVTAIVMMLLGAAIVFLLLEVRDGGALALLGSVYLGIGLFLMNKPDKGEFRQQVAVAVSAAGAALITIGIAAAAEAMWPAAIVAPIVAAGVIFAAKDLTLQFLVSSMAAFAIGGTLLHEQVPYILDITALATPFALLLFLYPPQRNLYPTAFVILLAFPLMSLLAFDGRPYNATDLEVAGLFARVLHIGLFAWLAFLHQQHAAEPVDKTAMIVFVLSAALLSVLLPSGGSAALVIMMLAFVLGSHLLAGIGTLLQLQFIVRFYYDLQMTLLDKSLLLMGVGAVLTIAWWFIETNSREAKRQ